MLAIARRHVNYYSHDLGMKAQHYILIADHNDKKTLLSYPNLFLYNHTRTSLTTSARYSAVISMFYRFISSLPEFKAIDPGYYHALTTNKHIKRWQLARKIESIRAQKSSPSSETIFEDAKILLIFFRWIITCGYVTSVDVKLVTWVANFKNQRMLNYIKQQSITTIDSKSMRALEKERRQKKSTSLITSKEIRTYLSSFHDPVYASMFKLALATAMRPVELCNFPYIGNGANKHIMPLSEMNVASPVIHYTISRGKGNKRREIVINRDDLSVLEMEYIIPHYRERADKYKKKYGRTCPPSILFLTAEGDPVDTSRVANRGSVAKRIAMAKDPSFRGSITFYSSRKWWPTMFLVNFFKGDLLTEKASVLYAAAAEVLKNQMGHEELAITYKHYVDAARVLVMAHEGRMNELVKAPGETVRDFINRMDMPLQGLETKLAT
jgi:integrase